MTQDLWYPGSSGMSQKLRGPESPQMAPDPTSGQPHPALTGPGIADATRSVLSQKCNTPQRSVML